MKVTQETKLIKHSDTIILNDCIIWICLFTTKVIVMRTNLLFLLSVGRSSAAHDIFLKSHDTLRNFTCMYTSVDMHPKKCIRLSSTSDIITEKNTLRPKQERALHRPMFKPHFPGSIMNKI